MAITTVLEFHSGNELSLGFDKAFGKLEITVTDGEMPSNTWDVKFDIDCSGSMEDMCKDSKTKMQHIKHTMINILRMFSECTICKYNVSVATFDNEYTLLFDFSEINASNVDEFIEKLKKYTLKIQRILFYLYSKQTLKCKIVKLHSLLTNNCIFY